MFVADSQIQLKLYCVKYISKSVPGRSYHTALVSQSLPYMNFVGSESTSSGWRHIQILGLRLKTQFDHEPHFLRQQR